MNGLNELATALVGASFATAVAWFLLRKVVSLLDAREETIRNHMAHAAEVMSDLRLAVMELTFILKGQRK